MNLRAFFPSDISRTIERLLQAVIAVNCAMLAFYITTTYRLFFHSDSAVKNLLAEEIVRTGQFFPRDWNYVNGDLFVIFGHLFILPFIPFFKNGFALHAVSGLVSCVLILASLWLLLKELDVSKLNRLLFVALVTTGISPYFAENVFGQVSYGALLYVALFLLYFVLRYLRRSQTAGVAQALTDLVAIGVIVFLVCLGNPQRALATFGLPLFAGLACAVFNGRSASPSAAFLVRRSILALLAVALSAAVLGAITHLFVLSQLTNNYYQAANASFLEYHEVVRNFVGTIHGLLYLLGGEASPGRSVVSILGAYEALRIVFAAAMLLAPLGMIMALRRQSDPRVMLVTVFAIASLAIVSFFHVFTTVPVMSDARSSSRYFTLPLVALLVALFVQMDRAIGGARKELQFGWLLIFLPILAGGVLTLMVPAFQRPLRPSAGLTVAGGQYDSVLSLLRSNGLQYGYASYWQANVLTVLSGGEVKVRPVVANPHLEPMRHLASNAWYRPSAHVGPSFLLLREQDYQAIDLSYIDVNLGKPGRVIKQEGWVVMIYPFNIATRLSWGAQRHSSDSSLTDYRYRIRMVAAPKTMVTGETGVYELEVSNLGAEIYSSAGTAPVNLGVHLLDASGSMLNNDLSRARLPKFLGPGKTQRVLVPIRIDQDGQYKLSFDLVQEGVTWFASRGGGSELVVETSSASSR